MRKFIFTILLFTFCVTPKAQRNVILIIADDLGTDYCGFYEDHADTANLKNIRRLLPKSVRFTNAMSNPVCSPTRAGMLTGRYSFRTGVGDAIAVSGSATLDTTEKTIPRILKQYNSNIKTANVGKWHLNFQAPISNLKIPNLIGYDYFAGNFTAMLNSYTNWSKVTNGTISTSTNYATTETTNDAIGFIKAQNTNPFFLWLAYNAPHTPIHLPPVGLHSYTTLSGTTANINANPKPYYRAMLEALDHEIGRLFDSLILYNKMDSTDIIFIGDNGNGVLSAQIANANRAKGTVYQYGVHVPFIISGPSVISPNRVSNELVNTHDLFATIIELFGNNNWQTQIPSTTVVDSKSIMPILKNQSGPIRPWAFTEIFKVTTDSADGKAMRNKDYKLIKFNYGGDEFYNLTTDPTESNNLLLGALNSTEYTNYLYLCGQMTSLVGASNFCRAVTVPISLDYFKGTILESKAILQWMTLNEVNNNYFDIEKSHNAKDFFVIGTVKAKENSTAKTIYEFVDEKLLNGNNYYRLKQNDASGKYSFSNIVSLKNIQENIIAKVCPNPATNYIGIELKEKLKENYLITLSNIEGKIIYKSNFNKNSVNFQIPTQNFVNGNYILSLSNKNTNNNFFILINK
jgi:arylsulfatase A-like enzyme